MLFETQFQPYISRKSTRLCHPVMGEGIRQTNKIDEVQIRAVIRAQSTPLQEASDLWAHWSIVSCWSLLTCSNLIWLVLTMACMKHKGWGPTWWKGTLKGGKREKWNLKLSFSAFPCKINPSTACRTSAAESTNINVKKKSRSVFFLLILCNVNLRWKYLNCLSRSTRIENKNISLPQELFNDMIYIC